MVSVCVNTGCKGWSCKSGSGLTTLELIAEGWDFSFVSNFAEFKLSIIRRVISVDGVACVGVAERATIRVIAIIRGFSVIISESEWLCGPVSLSNLSLWAKCIISSSVSIETIISGVGIIIFRSNNDSTLGISDETNSIIVGVINVDLDITLGISVEATGLT